MGVVYQGTQLNVDPPRDIAVKTLKPGLFSEPKVRERFEREARLARRLEHAGVARVIDFGVDEEVPFLVMERVGGVDLSTVIRQEAPLRPSRALRIMQRITEVLLAAHEHNLVHRDLKPSNIRILEGREAGQGGESGQSGDGDSVAIKVLDFGIAKDVGAAQDQLTTTGSLLGTPMYLSPEQAVGATKQLDCRADQYAAGVILYEMLAGHPPFNGTTVASVLFAHVMKTPPPLPNQVPEPLRRVVMRMLKKQPAERFPDPQALAQALADCEPVCARAPAAPRSEAPVGVDSEAILPGDRTRRRKLGLAAFAFLAVLIVGLYAVAPPRRDRPASFPETPRVEKKPEGSALPAAPAAVHTSELPAIARPESTATSVPDLGVKPSTPPQPAVGPSAPEKKPVRPQRPQKDPFEVPVAR